MDESVGISLDTDMMDEDEITAIDGPQEQTQQPAQLNGQPPLQFAAWSSTDIPEGVQRNKVHLRGLDNMSTTHVKEFLTQCGAPEPGKFEWIDDTSLNLVYADEQACAAVLELLSSPSALQVAPWDLREAKRADSHPLARLEIRVARETDRKEKGARERSRYYLFHPEDDHVEQREKQRREREEARREARREGRGQYRERDYPDRRSRSGSGEYNRRYYDDAENSRRNDSSRYGRDGDMYNDGDDSADDRRSRRQNEGVELFGERPRRSNDGVELFGDRSRKANEGVELFPSKPTDRRNEGVELFSSSSGQGSSSRPRRARSRSPVELFPDRRSHSKNDSVELFPEKLSGSGRRRRSASPSGYRLPTPPRTTLSSDPVPQPPRRGQSPPKANQKKTRSLESRVELFPERVQNRDNDVGMEGAGRSLESRIATGASNDTSGRGEPSGFSIRGAAARDDGFSIRGAAASGSASDFSIRGAGGQAPSANAGVELLPNKGSLFSRIEEPNKGSRRAGRSRAQDLFG